MHIVVPVKIVNIQPTSSLLQVLEDALLENQTSEKFQRVNKVKGDGAVALDSASRRTCPHLHLFVSFSSVACGRGNPGELTHFPVTFTQSSFSLVVCAM